MNTLEYLIANPWVVEARPMKVCVYGLWHLGTVTAACLASRGISTVGLAETPKQPRPSSMPASRRCSSPALTL